MPKINIIEDANFIVSFLNPEDSYHNEAKNFTQLIIDYKFSYIYPEIVLTETIFTLMKVGFNSRKIGTKIYDLTLIPEVTIKHNDIHSVISYTSNQYNHFFNHKKYGVKHITHTNDYVIACNAADYKAVVLTADRQIRDCLLYNGIKCFDYTKQSEYDKFKVYLQNIF